MTPDYPDTGRDDWTAEQWAAWRASLAHAACFVLDSQSGARFVIRLSSGRISSPMAKASAHAEMRQNHHLQRDQWARDLGYTGDTVNQPYEQALAAGEIDTAVLDGRIEEVIVVPDRG